MTGSHNPVEITRLKYQTVRPYLNERGRRLWAAAEAVSFGRGGSSLVCHATGLSSATVAKGIKEFNASGPVEDRVRRKGGGRKNRLSSKVGLSKPLINLSIRLQKVILNPHYDGQVKVFEKSREISKKWDIKQATELFLGFFMN